MIVSYKILNISSKIEAAPASLQVYFPPMKSTDDLFLNFIIFLQKFIDFTVLRETELWDTNAWPRVNLTWQMI